MSKTLERRERWAVLGGGMLGLTLALRLAQRGYEVQLIEAAPTLGGLTSSWHHNGLSWDRYYHVIEASDVHLIGLLGELGLAPDIVWGVTKTNFYAGNTLHPLNDVFDYAHLPTIGLIDKTRLALNILYGSRIRNGIALEKQTAEDWLVRWSGQRTFDKLWRPLLRAKLGDNFHRASAAYVWSVIRRFYGARHGHRKTELFGYLPGGYSRIIDTMLAVLERKGVKLEIGTDVTGVELTKQGIEVATAGGARAFDKAIVTFASPIAARTCAGLTTEEKARHEQILYQGVVCASFLSKRPLGGAYLTYITDDTLPFTTVIEMSSLVDRRQLNDYHLIYLPKYVPSDDTLLQAKDTDIKDLFLGGLRQMFPDLVPADIDAFQVARTRYVLAIPTLNYSDRLPPISTTVRDLYICNSAHIVNASLSVNETVDLANRTVDQLSA